MTNVSNFHSEETLLEKVQIPVGHHYAVYDSCVTNHVPSFDLAFVEERTCGSTDAIASGEKYFNSLKEAKVYVRNHFKSGGEYFSVKQANNPDDFLQIIIDKVTYLIA